MQICTSPQTGNHASIPPVTTQNTTRTILQSLYMSIYSVNWHQKLRTEGFLLLYIALHMQIYRASIQNVHRCITAVHENTHRRNEINRSQWTFFAAYPKIRALVNIPAPQKRAPDVRGKGTDSLCSTSSEQTDKKLGARSVTERR